MTEKDQFKFDVVIGNPPYQDNSIGESTQTPPIYHLFMEDAYKVGEIVELITPGRFLFNAGATPNSWNKKMLKDEHLKILYYEQNSAKVFPNTDIKGGVVVTYRNRSEDYGAITVFSPFRELQSILRKVIKKKITGLNSIMYGQNTYKFTEEMHKENPEAKQLLSKGHAYDLTTSVFSRLKEIFLNTVPEDGDYIKIIGREDGKRVYKYVKRKYIINHENLDKYKVLLPKSNGSGALGETLSTPLIGEPLIGHTQTFISIGAFDNLLEAENAMKYIKTKFARTLLGLLKITQDNPPAKWKFVPLQDFTANSDIDWTKSIPEIDQQLYKKYGLSEEEIDFIETHVKEMD